MQGNLKIRSGRVSKSMELGHDSATKSCDKSLLLLFPKKLRKDDFLPEFVEFLTFLDFDFSPFWDKS